MTKIWDHLRPRFGPLHGRGTIILVIVACLAMMSLPARWAEAIEGSDPAPADTTPVKNASPRTDTGARPDEGHELSWEMPGRVSIYDLQLGAATRDKDHWKFLGSGKRFRAGSFKDRLTLMVRFAYRASRAEIPLKFVIRLPNSRQYEETVRLANRSGQYSYVFTVHNPEDFLGTGSVYLYYGFSIVDVLDFTITPGS